MSGWELFGRTVCVAIAGGLSTWSVASTPPIVGSLWEVVGRASMLVLGIIFVIVGLS